MEDESGINVQVFLTEREAGKSKVDSVEDIISSSKG